MLLRGGVNDQGGYFAARTHPPEAGKVIIDVHRASYLIRAGDNDGWRGKIFSLLYFAVTCKCRMQCVIIYSIYIYYNT